MICPNCKRELPDGYKFCPHEDCGADLRPAKSATPELRCPKCGAEVSEESKFCKECGASIESSAYGLSPQEEQTLKNIRVDRLKKLGYELKRDLPDDIVTVYDIISHPVEVYSACRSNYRTRFGEIKTALTDLFERYGISLTILTKFFKQITEKELKASANKKTASIIATIMYVAVHIAAFILLHTFTNIHIAWLIVWSVISSIAIIINVISVYSVYNENPRIEDLGVYTWVFALIVFALIAAIFGITLLPLVWKIISSIVGIIGVGFLVYIIADGML
ncbi:MAG: zinc ribbon domain-containing protein [Spirochaetaceae bacterium]|jgi:hypothetical protein|nr:zinc ribbon domain-containing protein [Spirochaetaceae bacterium]